MTCIIIFNMFDRKQEIKVYDERGELQLLQLIPTENVIDAILKTCENFSILSVKLFGAKKYLEGIVKSINKKMPEVNCEIFT